MKKHESLGDVHTCIFKEKGITLIALVITIIILIILASISIGAIMNGGLITNAQEAAIQATHATLYEKLQLKALDYEARKEINGDTNTLIEELESKEFIKKSTINENEYIINTKKLCGTKLNLGNGTDEKKDVYKLILKNTTDNVSKYDVIYYKNSDTNTTTVGELYNELDEEIENSSPVEWFNYITNDNNEIEIIGFNFNKLDYAEVEGRGIYASNVITINAEKLVIPSEIDGKPVTKLRFNTHIGLKIDAMEVRGIKEIVYPKKLKILEGSHLSESSQACFPEITTINLPSELESIGSYCFALQSEVQEITIPSSVQTIRSRAFFWCGLEIKVEGKDSKEDFTCCELYSDEYKKIIFLGKN